MEDGRVRLAKLIARRGAASRREAERLIEAGEVTVNGKVVSGVVLVDAADDQVRVSGRLLPAEPPLVYYAMYKPKGTITSRSDPHGRRSVLELVEHLAHRVEPIGRLDYDTEGLLLLTNDGDLAHALSHPSQRVPKRYLAKVYRTPDERDLATLESGVFLEDGKTAPAKARVVDTTDRNNAWVEITVTEGRNRLIRRMMGALGHPVSKLRRESFATIALRGLDRGQVRALTGEEVKRLKEIGEGGRPSRAGRKKGKGFAKAKPKAVKPNHRKRRS